MNSVLLIEDDPIGAVMVRRMLESAHIMPETFQTVADIRQGLEIAIAKPPDLIISDLVVPPIGEQECINEYLPLLSQIAPVGVWTGSVNPDVIIQCHAAGAHFCLIKQHLNKEKCGIERLSQAVSDAVLNWRREHATR